MGRLYEELKCGCLVSCDGGGGLIPYGCDGGPDCQFDEWCARHPLCSWCGDCLACYPDSHSGCQTNIGDEGEIIPSCVAWVGTRGPTADEIRRGKELEPLARECLAYGKLLGIAEAAQAYIEATEEPYQWGGEYDKLVQAVKRWQGMKGVCDALDVYTVGQMNDE